jgi:hypothetical protein
MVAAAGPEPCRSRVASGSAAPTERNPSTQRPHAVPTYIHTYIHRVSFHISDFITSLYQNVQENATCEAEAVAELRLVGDGAALVRCLGVALVPAMPCHAMPRDEMRVRSR